MASPPIEFECCMLLLSALKQQCWQRKLKAEETVVQTADLLNESRSPRKLGLGKTLENTKKHEARRYAVVEEIPHLGAGVNAGTLAAEASDDDG